jgi:hypothetical protein
MNAQPCCSNALQVSACPATSFGQCWTPAMSVQHGALAVPSKSQVAETSTRVQVFDTPENGGACKSDSQICCTPL